MNIHKNTRLKRTNRFNYEALLGISYMMADTFTQGDFHNKHGRATRVYVQVNLEKQGKGTLVSYIIETSILCMI